MNINLPNPSDSKTLRTQLTYVPTELKFGTSGRRGLVADLSQLEIYLNVLAELKYLQTLPRGQGGIKPGDEIFLAFDLRPSSTRYVAQLGNRGEIAQAAFQAIGDAEMIGVNCGQIPTPALTYFALQHGKASIMATGSHIPFDRNGYKLNTAKGELLKEHEAPINESVREVREAIYGSAFKDSLFSAEGNLKAGHCPLPAVSNEAAEVYVRRYTDFFKADALKGRRILLYEHSAVGRDILRFILEQLGAEVVPSGRSESFVPIDTENIEADQLEVIQGLADSAAKSNGPLDAIVSIDGDSDRPLLLGMEPNGKVKFFGGDLVGMIVAEYLQADAVVVPISCNDAIDRSNLAPKLEPKTRIGSPHVIAGMEGAVAKGKRSVCGWEANGGFLLGSDVMREGKVLRALPTRDAVLPILCTLLSAFDQHLTLPELFAKLPKRFSRAALLKNFPRSISLRIIQQFSPDAGKDDHRVRKDLRRFFPAHSGFGDISELNYVDGVRITFDNEDVVHIRPSGNADELRVYAVANTQERANEIAEQAIAEPDGILRTMERWVAK